MNLCVHVYDSIVNGSAKNSDEAARMAEKWSLLELEWEDAKTNLSRMRREYTAFSEARSRGR